MPLFSEQDIQTNLDMSQTSRRSHDAGFQARRWGVWLGKCEGVPSPTLTSHKNRIINPGSSPTPLPFGRCMVGVYGDVSYSRTHGHIRALEFMFPVFVR